MLNKPSQQRFFLVVFLTCAALVTWGVFRHTPPQELFNQSDKAAHILAFAALAFTGRMALPGLSAYSYWPMLAAAAIFMEYFQGQLQLTRLSSLEDAVANLVGIVLAYVALKLLRLIKYRMQG